ncbi:MAG: hypothetical protein AAFY41_08265, partial [Bacteroidota bacterium]
RSYDPVLGRFFAVDPAGQFASPYNGMGNAPHFAVDPNGEFAFLAAVAIGAVIGGMTSGIAAEANGGNFWDGAWKGALVGGLAGGAGAFATAGITAAANGVGLSAISSGMFSAGLGATIAGGAAGGFVGGAGSAWMNGASFSDGLSAGATGALVGGVAAGAAYGIKGGITQIRNNIDAKRQAAQSAAPGKLDGKGFSPLDVDPLTENIPDFDAMVEGSYYYPVEVVDNNGLGWWDYYYESQARFRTFMSSGAITPVYPIYEVGSIGAGRVFSGARYAASRGASTATARGTNVVYQGFDAAGDVRYVGITSREPGVRFAEHLNSGTSKSLLRYRVVEGATGLSRSGARVFEQRLINQFGLQRNGGQLFNKINSISPKKWHLHGIK